MISAGTFRQSFPEFGNVTIYPDSAIDYWINIGRMMLSQDRFGAGADTPISPPATTYDAALELFVAHNIVVEKQAGDAARAGGTPGLSQGPISSKSVGPLSVSYDTSAGLDPDAGHWNLTVFGTRLWKLIQMFGAGPVQITGAAPPWGPGWGEPWPGPISGQF